MKKVLFLAILITNCSNVYKKTVFTNRENFEQLLRSNSLEVRNLILTGYEEIKINKESTFKYDYAIKNENLQVEIRYHIKSYREKLRNYEEFAKKNPSAVLAKPSDHNYLDDFLINLMNLAGDNPKMQSNPLSEKILLDKFNANWGSNSLFEFDPKLKFNYKYCGLIVLHKKDTADVYIYFLGKDIKDLLGQVEQNFTNLKFI